MKQYKFLAVFLSLALAVVFCSGMPAFADGISSSVVQDGDNVIFTIYADETIHDFSGIRFDVTAPEGFTYVSHALNGELDEVSNPPALKFMGDNIRGFELKAGDVICSIVFTHEAELEPGDYVFTCSIKEAYDFNLEDCMKMKGARWQAQPKS